MTTPKASGPLWACMIGNCINTSSIMTKERAPHAHTVPVRVVPGHGKVVPVELVEAIWENWDDAFDAGDHDERMADLLAAIRAALEGSI